MPEQRRCNTCGTNYESIDELHMGGFCPSCGSYRHTIAVKSDYKLRPKPEPEPESEPESEPTPERGSTEDYLAE